MEDFIMSSTDAQGSHSENHQNEAIHHHHSHTADSHHPHGHHLLQVENLSVEFCMYESVGKWSSRRVESKVLDNLCISVHDGEILAVVGASGSGKTVLADSIMGLFEPNARVSGTIFFNGQRQSAESLGKLRGNEIAFVPQSVKSLNPLMKIGKQIGGSREERLRLYEQYRLDASVEEKYPHELSGGMARRVLLCTALITTPKLILADEPTPGLDLELAIKAMEDFRAFADAGGGVLLITHDIQLALRVADRIAVFKDGTVVEETAVANFSDASKLHHEFSRQLLRALPENEFASDFDERNR